MDKVVSDFSAGVIGDIIDIWQMVLQKINIQETCLLLPKGLLGEERIKPNEKKR
jgi:hypothetical protein